MRERAVRDHLLGARRDWVSRTLDCADAVAETWDAPDVADRDRVVAPFRAALERSGVLEAAPAVLGECVDAVGEQLRARPVAGPPYVVVTGQGLLLRATLDDARLVVRIETFTVQRDPVRYVRSASTPGDAVTVEIVDPR